VGNINKADYDAQKAACNLTIQHTVANANNDLNIVPIRVMEIVLEEEEEEGGRSSFRNGRVFSALAASSVLLKYKIIVKDPLLTVETLRAGLMEASSSGRMDRDLHFFTTQFGATVLANVTLSLPQVTNAAVPRDSSSQLTGVMIALLVIGIVMALGVLGTMAVWFGLLSLPRKPTSVPQPFPRSDDGARDPSY